MMSGVPTSLMLATLTDRRDFGDGLAAGAEVRRRALRRAQGRRRRAAGVAHRKGPDAVPTRRCAPPWRTSAGRRLLLDGEVVAFDGEQTSFGRLPAAARSRPGRLRSWWRRLPGRVLRVRPAGGSTARISRGRSLRRAPRVAGAGRFGRAPRLQLSEAWRGDSERRFAGGVPVGLGGADRQARRRALHVAVARVTG